MKYIFYIIFGFKFSYYFLYYYKLLLIFLNDDFSNIFGSTILHVQQLNKTRSKLLFLIINILYCLICKIHSCIKTYIHIIHYFPKFLDHFSLVAILFQFFDVLENFIFELNTILQLMTYLGVHRLDVLAMLASSTK